MSIKEERGKVAPAAIAGLVVGSFFVASFSLLQTCIHPQLPQLEMTIDDNKDHRYINKPNTVEGKCFNRGFDYIQSEAINITIGSEITLSVDGYGQPDEWIVTLQKDGINESGLRRTSSFTYVVDEDNIQPGEYALLVQLRWDDINIPVSYASYFYRLKITE